MNALDFDLSALLFLIVYLAIIALLAFGWLRLAAVLFSRKIRASVVAHPGWNIALFLVTFAVSLGPCNPFHGVQSRRAGQRAKAQAESRFMEVSIRSFFRDYGRYPIAPAPGEDHTYEGDDYARLVTILRGYDPVENPRREVYLEVAEQSLTPAGAFLDPWRRPYHVRADWNGDGEVTVGGMTLRRLVAVWSSGKNGINEWGAGDDIASWHR